MLFNYERIKNENQVNHCQVFSTDKYVIHNKKILQSNTYTNTLVEIVQYFIV